MVGREQGVRVAIAAGAAAVAGLATAWLLRNGLSPTLDASSYLSATREVAAGHPFTTRLAPSFSNFDVIEFLDRGGRLPFVDFPVGYPLVAGLLAVVIGAKAGLVVVTIASVLAVVVLAVAAAGGREAGIATLVVRALAGIGIVSLSTYRVVTRSVLSEPFFCAIVVGLVAALLHYRRTQRQWWVVVVLAAASGLVRFVGAPLALLVVLERRRRGGGIVRPLLWGASCALPAGVNVVWANAAGGGHSAGWRGIHADDVRWFVRSVGGWIDARQGNIGLTYFGGEGPAWWAWALTVVWLGAGVLALVGLFRMTWSRLPAPLELGLAASLILTVGVVVGMAGFDSLVAPENRVMLPAGVLVLIGATWSLRLTGTRRTWAGAAVVAVWWIAAVFARGPNLFDRRVPEPLSADAARASAAAIVIGTDADPVSWWTGLPAAYLPLQTVALTGREVDTAPLWAALPCAMARADGVVVVLDGVSFFEDPRANLDTLVDAGLLTVDRYDGATAYRPVPDACSG